MFWQLTLDDHFTLFSAWFQHCDCNIPTDRKRSQARSKFRGEQQFTINNLPLNDAFTSAQRRNYEWNTIGPMKDAKTFVKFWVTLHDHFVIK